MSLTSEQPSVAPEPTSPASAEPLAPYDAVVLLSYGGPDKPDDVLPFLRNATAGKGIPDERLVAVGEHYYLFNGRSPINQQNLAMQAAVQGELHRRRSELRVLWGNRNWDPYLTDTLRSAATDGARRFLVLTTSVYSSYSSCRQYREDLAAAQETLRGEGVEVEIDQIRRGYDLPGFREANLDAVTHAVERLLAAGTSAERIRVVFVTHSIPISMAETSGPAGNAYVAQHLEVAESVMAGVHRRTGSTLAHDLTYCSRSGPPSMPWLEPDVNDHLEHLAHEGVEAVVISPIGFVSDHMEVAYDLDTEAVATAERLGLAVERVPTASLHPAFVRGVVDRLMERAAQARGEAGELPPPNGPRCAPGCCRNARAPQRPAACELPSE